MNLLSLFNERVYIKIYDTSNENLPTQHISNMDMSDLLFEVAKANPNGDTQVLYDEKNNKIYLGRTKSFIIHKTESFLLGILEEEQPTENMANFVSKRQLEKLIASISSRKKNISCYGLVFLYVIYTLLDIESEPAKLCKKYIHMYDKVILDYLEHYQDDQIAAFFHGCYLPIINAINNKNCFLDSKELPPRPRKHPKNFSDEDTKGS